MKRNIVLFVLMIFVLSGCSFFGETRRYANRTTSLVDFLYPDGAVPEEDIKYPVLNLPLRVGLAYTPSRSSDSSISPALKQNLIEQIKYAFSQKHYINEIVVIPEIYLANNRGFSGLEQVKRLYQLDVIALISYDQVAQTSDNGLALTYLSIVGSYVFHGTD